MWPCLGPGARLPGPQGTKEAAAGERYLCHVSKTARHNKSGFAENFAETAQASAVSIRVESIRATV